MARKTEQSGGAGGRESGQEHATGAPSSPEAAMGAWLAWLKDQVGGAAGQGPAGGMASAWMQPPGGPAAAGMDRPWQLLDQDPMLATVDRMWNANPLKEVIPVDWGEIVRALRTVWLRRMADPARALPAIMELNAQMAKSAVEAWNDAAARWWGLAQDKPQPGPAAQDKRFDAPEWQSNPVYRTLRDLYLLASDFLLGESQAEDLEPAERERLRFHLEQFVNATSPTLLLFGNPAALRRAMETGGASIAEGARNLMRLSLIHI